MNGILNIINYLELLKKKQKKFLNKLRCVKMNCKSCEGYIPNWDIIGQYTGYCRFHRGLYYTQKEINKLKNKLIRG